MRRVLRILTAPTIVTRGSIVLLALLASATSLVNGFVYDDRPIILENARVHTLARWWEALAQPYWPPNWGDTNYRPFTILSFAIQWAIGGGRPFVFHATSIVLYVVTCLAVLRLARLVLPISSAWLVAALFAVHPVHVEAVGNVVGQPELVVAICSTLATAVYVRMRTRVRAATSARRSADDRGAVIAIGACYIVACLSKETGFFLPGLLIAAECTVVATALGDARRPLRTRARELWPLYSTCAAIAIGYLVLRRSVLGGFGDDPNTVIALLSHKARLLTMVGVVPEWARLLVWPAKLSADYSPADIAVIIDWAPTVLPGLFILAGFLVLCAASWRGPRVATFGLLWTAVAIFPVSNIFLRSGVIVAERTLFLPSIGALLAAGAATVWLRRRGNQLGLAHPRLGVALAATILALGAIRSSSRQRVWRNSDEFLRTIVDDAPRGYRAHYMHGMWQFEKGHREEGERHVRMAIALFPYDAGPYTDLGDEYRKAGLCTPARDLYRRAISLGVLRDRARLGLVACLLQDAHFTEASEEARTGVASGGGEVKQFRRLLAIADSAVAATSAVRPAGALRRDGGHKKGVHP